MPQKRIPLLPGCCYHIWTHANGDENLFRSEENYTYFLDRYHHHVHPVVETYAYCLMPNHLHVMVRVRSKEELKAFLKEKNKKKKKKPNLQGFGNLGGLVSQQFSNLFNGCTKAFNKMYDRKGSLFIPNFNRKLIDTDAYYIRLIACIHNNPVHHGFAKQPGEWLYSRWHAYLSNKKTHIEKEEAMQLVGGVKNFTEAHCEINMEKHTELFEK